jgi:uncharacterized protein YdeI (YjbR/CyaY-like superfamily)
LNSNFEITEIEKDGFQTFYADGTESWRNWLAENHKHKQAVWLIIYKKGTGVPSLSYEQAVEEALCFGWIDSKPNKRDDDSFYQFFAKRKPKSNWSALNKTRVEKLIAANKMQASGLAMVELAKQTGTWTALDKVEKLEIPADLQTLFDCNPVAEGYFAGFPKSSKRGILEWILNAKRPETRQKRIEETVRLATLNKRALFPD